MTKPKMCEDCGIPFKNHVREGRIVFCIGPIHEPPTRDELHAKIKHEIEDYLGHWSTKISVSPR